MTIITKTIDRIRQFFPLAIAVPFNVLFCKKIHVPIAVKAMLNNQMHNGSKRLLIAKYVALPRKCSVEKPVIHTMKNDMKKNTIIKVNTDCFLKMPLIVRKVLGGLLISFMNAATKVKIPMIMNAIIANRFEEYPKRRAVFLSEGRVSRLIKLIKPDNTINPVPIMMIFLVL